MNDDLKKVQNALIKLYMMVKIRKGSEKTALSSEEKLEEENELRRQNLLTLIEYIKSSFDIALSIQLEQQIAKYKADIEEDNANAAEKYETLLRKEEGNIRQHISIEHQLKLYAEKLSDRIEDLEKENEYLNSQLARYKCEIKNTEEIESLKRLLKNYEDQNFKYSQNEKKLKVQIAQKEKEIKHLETKLLNRTNLNLLNNLAGTTNTNFNGININSIHSNNSSMCSHSRSKSKMNEEEKRDRAKLLKNSPLASKRIAKEKQLEEYKKLIDKRLHDITRNKNSRSFRNRSNSNISIRSKDKSLNKSSINNSNISNNNELSTRLNELSSRDKKNKTPIKKIPIHTSNKKAFAVYMKKNHNKIIVNKIIKDSNGDEIPIVINNSAMPCFNNINIFAGGTNNNNTNISEQPNVIIAKSAIESSNNSSGTNSNYNSQAQLNLRQFIFSKCGNKAK